MFITTLSSRGSALVLDAQAAFDRIGRILAEEVEAELCWRGDIAADDDFIIVQIKVDLEGSLYFSGAQGVPPVIG